MSAPDIASPPPEAETDETPAPEDDAVADRLDDLDVGSGAEAEDGPEAETDDPDVAEVDLTEDDLDAGEDLFSGDEEADGGSSGSDPEGDDGDDGSESAEDAAEDLFEFDEDSKEGQMADAINEGAARLAVSGLEGDEKDDLEDEFAEVFGSFRLGYFGAEAAEEYVFSGDDDVDPLWGLLGTMIICAAFSLYMRPDGDEQVQRMKDAIGNMTDGVQA